MLSSNGFDARSILLLVWEILFGVWTLEIDCANLHKWAWHLLIYSWKLLKSLFYTPFAHCLWFSVVFCWTGCQNISAPNFRMGGLVLSRLVGPRSDILMVTSSSCLNEINQNHDRTWKKSELISQQNLRYYETAQSMCCWPSLKQSWKTLWQDKNLSQVNFGIRDLWDLSNKRKKSWTN